MAFNENITKAKVGYMVENAPPEIDPKEYVRPEGSTDKIEQGDDVASAQKDIAAMVGDAFSNRVQAQLKIIQEREFQEQYVAKTRHRNEAETYTLKQELTEASEGPLTQQLQQQQADNNTQTNYVDALLAEVNRGEGIYVTHEVEVTPAPTLQEQTIPIETSQAESMAETPTANAPRASQDAETSSPSTPPSRPPIKAEQIGEHLETMLQEVHQQHDVKDPELQQLVDISLINALIPKAIDRAQKDQQDQQDTQPRPQRNIKTDDVQQVDKMPELPQGSQVIDFVLQEKTIDKDGHLVADQLYIKDQQGNLVEVGAPINQRPAKKLEGKDHAKKKTGRLSSILRHNKKVDHSAKQGKKSNGRTGGGAGGMQMEELLEDEQQGDVFTNAMQRYVILPDGSKLRVGPPFDHYRNWKGLRHDREELAAKEAELKAKEAEVKAIELTKEKAQEAQKTEQIQQQKAANEAAAKALVDQAVALVNEQQTNQTANSNKHRKNARQKPSQSANPQQPQGGVIVKYITIIKRIKVTKITEVITQKITKTKNIFASKQAQQQQAVQAAKAVAMQQKIAQEQRAAALIDSRRSQLNAKRSDASARPRQQAAPPASIAVEGTMSGNTFNGTARIKAVNPGAFSGTAMQMLQNLGISMRRNSQSNNVGKSSNSK